MSNLHQNGEMGSGKPTSVGVSYVCYGQNAEMLTPSHQPIESQSNRRAPFSFLKRSPSKLNRKKRKVKIDFMIDHFDFF